MGTASAKAIFEADDSRMDAAMLRIQKQLGHTGEKFNHFSHLAHRGLELVGIAFVAEKLKHGLHGVLEWSEHLELLGQASGMATGEMALTEKMMGKIGKTGEDGVKVIGKMQKALATGSENQLLRRLGIDLEAIRRKSPSEQFLEIGKAIAHIEDPAQRVAAAMAVFGKTGAGVLALFHDGRAESVARTWKSTADVLNENGGVFAALGVKFAGMMPKFQQLMIGIADRVAGVLLPILDRIDKIDLVKYGQAAGEGLGVYTQAAGEGRLWELYGASAKVAVDDWMPKWVNRLADMIPGMDTQAQNQAKLASLMLEFQQHAQKVREEQQAKHPGAEAGKGTGLAEDNLFGGISANVSDLQRRGGGREGFGGGVGESILSETQLQTGVQEETRDELQQLRRFMENNFRRGVEPEYYRPVPERQVPVPRPEHEISYA